MAVGEVKMIELVKPEFHTCVRYTEKEFWKNIILSEELNEFIEFTFPRISEMQSIYWVVGDRGSGKSQVLEIIARSCMQKYTEWNILPIVVSIEALESDPNPKEVLETLCSRIATSVVFIESKFNEALEAIEVEPSTVWGRKIFEELSKYQDKFEPEPFSNIFKLSELLKQVSGGKIKYVLLIDELDKINPMSYFDFLIHNQNLFSNLIELKAKMFISMRPEVYNMIKEKEGEEADFFRSSEINPPSITTPDECKKIIESRIKMKKSDWRSPFDIPSYSVIMKNCNGIPRKILREAGYILESAYKKNLPSIPHEYVVDHFKKGESEKEFEEEINDLMYEVTALSRLVKELENRDYCSILNVFLLKKDAARIGDFLTLQSLGLTFDRAKYKVLIKDMEIKGLLKDRGYGPIINPDLEKYLKEVKTKYRKTPLDISNELSSKKIKPPIEVSEEKKLKVYDREPIDTAIIDIIEKNPYSTIDEIKKKLKNYQTAQELEKWRKITIPRIAKLAKAEKVVKIPLEPEVYVMKMVGLTQKEAVQLGDPLILREINKIYPFMISENTNDHNVFTNSINNIIREIVGNCLDIKLPGKNNKKILKILQEKGHERLSKYFNMYLNARDLNDLELIYNNGLRILSEAILIRDEIKDFQIKKDELITQFSEEMQKLKRNEILKNIDMEKRDELDHLIRNLYSDYIPYKQIKGSSKLTGLTKGNILKCECGLELFSLSQSVNHIGCPNGAFSMKKVKEALRFTDLKKSTIFLLSIIEKVLKSDISNLLSDNKVTRYVSESGYYSYLIDTGMNIFIITNMSIDEDNLQNEFVKVITLDPKNDQEVASIEGINRKISEVTEKLR